MRLTRLMRPVGLRRDGAYYFVIKDNDSQSIRMRFGVVPGAWRAGRWPGAGQVVASA